MSVQKKRAARPVRPMNQEDVRMVTLHDVSAAIRALESRLADLRGIVDEIGKQKLDPVPCRKSRRMKRVFPVGFCINCHDDPA